MLYEPRARGVVAELERGDGLRLLLAAERRRERVAAAYVVDGLT